MADKVRFPLHPPHGAPGGLLALGPELEDTQELLQRKLRTDQ